MIIICPMCSNQFLWSIAVSGDRLEVWQILGRIRAINCHAQFDLTSGKRAERGHQGQFMHWNCLLIAATVILISLSPTRWLLVQWEATVLFMSSRCNLMPCWYNIMLLTTTKIQTYYKQLLWISHFNVCFMRADDSWQERWLVFHEWKSNFSFDLS